MFKELNLIFVKKKLKGIFRGILWNCIMCKENIIGIIIYGL